MAKPIPIKQEKSSATTSSRKSSLSSTIMDQSGAGKTKIGELLCKEGYIAKTHLQDALNYQKKNKGRLGSILIKLGYIDDETIVNVLSRLQNYPAIKLSKITPDKYTAQPALILLLIVQCILEMGFGNIALFA